MNLRIIVFSIFFISLVHSQIFQWSGNYKLWDVIPYHKHINRDQCCAPDFASIAQDPKNQSRITLSLKFSHSACHHLKGEVKLEEDISLGEFQDDKFNGFKAIFRPNNNTILMYPGIAGNCRWVLGRQDSIMTNASKIDVAKWEGVWNFTDYYSIKQGEECCVPYHPYTIAIDDVTRTMAGNVYFPHHSPFCPKEVIGQVLYYNFSIDGGAYKDIPWKTHGFMLQNGSILDFYGNCAFVLNKVTPKI